MPNHKAATVGRAERGLVPTLRYGKQYVDVGVDYYEKQYRERVLKNLAKRAAQFGLSLTQIGVRRSIWLRPQAGPSGNEG